MSRNYRFGRLGFGSRERGSCGSRRHWVKINRLSLPSYVLLPRVCRSEDTRCRTHKSSPNRQENKLRLQSRLSGPWVLFRTAPVLSGLTLPLSSRATTDDTANNILTAKTCRPRCRAGVFLPSQTPPKTSAEVSTLTPVTEERLKERLCKGTPRLTLPTRSG